MDVQALQLTARFSLPPNSLGYCGKDTAPEKFKRCILTGQCKGIDEEITKFIVLYPYLKTIAKIVGLDPLSYQTIESFWLGNDKLNLAKNSDYEILMDNFVREGVPDFFVEELRRKVPQKFIPFHLFQVLHVGVGRASGAVPFSLESINNCMIRWGKVTEINKNKALIGLNSLEKRNDKYLLTIKNESVSFNNDLISELKKGDVVTVHWEMAVKILTKQEEENIEHWTNEVLATISTNN